MENILSNTSFNEGSHENSNETFSNGILPNGIFLKFSDADYISRGIRNLSSYLQEVKESTSSLSEKIIQYCKDENIGTIGNSVLEAWLTTKKSIEENLLPMERCLELLLCGSSCGEKDDNNTEREKFSLYDITSPQEKIPLGEIFSLSLLPKVFQELKAGGAKGYKRILINGGEGMEFEVGKLF